MPATYEPIATTTSTGISIITFSSVPSTYTDIILVGVGYESNTATGNFVTIRVNSDNGTNYSRTILRGNGSSAISARVSNETGWYVDMYTNPSNFTCHFMNYSNTTTNKTMLSRYSNASTLVAANTNLWRSTSAITTITLQSSAGSNTLSGTFTLYGIKAA